MTDRGGRAIHAPAGRDGRAALGRSAWDMCAIYFFNMSKARCSAA